MFSHTLKLFSAIFLMCNNFKLKIIMMQFGLGFPGLGSNARALGMGNAFNALVMMHQLHILILQDLHLLKKIEAIRQD